MKLSLFHRMPLAITLLGLFSIGWAGVPNQPSIVTVSTTTGQLIVRKRLPDGTLSQPVPYTIKGVDWQPATRAPATGPIPPGYPFPSPGSNQYGFFYDWAGRNPQGHVVFNYWLSTEFQAHYQQDIPLMAQMHVNTVRLFGDFGDDPATYGPILDAFYNAHIMVIMSVASSAQDITTGRYLKVMQFCQNHPAILMFTIGNEWNLNNLYGTYPDLASAEAAVNSVIPPMRAQDPNHPISSCLGDPGSSAAMVSFVNVIPGVDIWSLNIYRGKSFGTIFADWAATGKPFFFSEFGIDSFQTTSYVALPPPNNYLTQSSTGFEDQPTQSNWDLALWSEIQANLSSLDITKNCAGGVVFSWNDQLWELSNYNVGLGPIPTGPASYAIYNSGGFIIPGASPDNVTDEEYFGIVDADRNPKQAYLDLEAYYPTVAPLPMASIAIAPSSVTVHYNQSQSLTALALDVFQEPVYLQPSSFTWSVSPSTGVSIDASGLFTSFVTSGTYWVAAQSGLFTSSLAVVVANAPPTITQPAGAAPNPVRSTGTTLSVQADDDRGEAGLTYTWSTTGFVSGPVQFLDIQRFNSSKTMRVAFSSAGQYVFIVTVQDLDGAQTTSQVVVQVDALSTPSGLPGDFAALRVYPSPWRSDLHAGHDITFDGLTANTTVKIFTVSGHWVRTLGPGDGIVTWDLKNDSGDLVASGLYFYLITNDQGQKSRGKLAIIR